MQTEYTEFLDLWRGLPLFMERDGFYRPCTPPCNVPHINLGVLQSVSSPMSLDSPASVADLY